LGAAAGAQDILGLAGHPIARWAAAWLGEAAAFAAAACGAICSVLYRPYLQRYPALAVSAFAMLGSVAALAIAASVNGIFAAPPRPSAAAWAAIVFVGVSSGIGYFALLWAYARASPTRVAVFQALAPLTAAALGWLFLGEAVSATFLAGLAAVMAGIVVAHR
jgi:drug/metabolite transporter (DMT)-like permease